jgi:hypothetical protein
MWVCNMKHQDLNCRQARWAQYLSRFNFQWLHKAGATIGKADALSRREDHSIGIEKDNTGVLVIPPDRICSVTEVHIATDADIVTVLGPHWDYHVFTSFSSIRPRRSSRCTGPFDVSKPIWVYHCARHAPAMPWTSRRCSMSLSTVV